MAASRSMTRFVRNYTVLSLAALLIGLVLFVMTYRLVAVASIVDLAQQNNITYGKAELRQIEAVLGDYLEATSALTGGSAREPALPEPLATAISDLMSNRGIARLKIYNDRGVVVFSSRRDQIGDEQADNVGFQNAMRGEVAAKLVYRDSFNAFDRATEDDNLVQTYIPVRKVPTGPVAGVLELYTDVDNLVRQAELSEFRILATGVFIVPLLWGAMLYFVSRTARVIANQQETIRERNATLANLSAHMMQSAEAERKRVAIHLHEGIAQTLSAIKLAMESAAARADTAANRDDAIVPLLQRTIGEVRTMAMELRPPALDDLGVLPAIAALCREVKASFPHLEIDSEFDTAEPEIPGPFKIVLYRSLAIALYGLARARQATLVHYSLCSRGAELILAIEHNGRTGSGTETSGVPEGSSAAPIDPLRERVILTGGDLKVGRDERGWTSLRMRWPR
jgi:signal transduction histidine kinase